MTQFGIPYGLVIFGLPDAGLAFLVFVHEDVEGGLWALLWLSPLILLPSAIFWTFRFDHPRRPLLSYDDFLSFGQLG
jgi:hypothetical protein